MFEGEIPYSEEPRLSTQINPAASPQPPYTANIHAYVLGVAFDYDNNTIFYCKSDATINRIDVNGNNKEIIASM